MELIAHRGCADEYPENTVRAIERSATRLPAVEFDVRRCGSGELVVFHDETVDRLTDGSGRIAETALARLRELEVLESGETIPLLSEALRAVPPGVRVQVELKQTGVAADAIARVDAASVDAHVTSFSREALREVCEADPARSTGYLFGRDVGVEDGLDAALELGCGALHPHAELCLETDVVGRAHRAGLAVVAWAADDRETFDGLRTLGVDGATTDSWTVAGGRPDAAASGRESGSGIDARSGADAT